MLSYSSPFFCLLHTSCPSDFLSSLGVNQENSVSLFGWGVFGNSLEKKNKYQDMLCFVLQKQSMQ